LTKNYFTLTSRSSYKPVTRHRPINFTPVPPPACSHPADPHFTILQDNPWTAQMRRLCNITWWHATLQ